VRVARLSLAQGVIPASVEPSRVGALGCDVSHLQLRVNKGNKAQGRAKRDSRENLHVCRCVGTISATRSSELFSEEGIPAGI
jgi:hypothetical protein